jgi:hypothetical protein
MSKARFCVGCGKKYYPNAEYSGGYPSQWYVWTEQGYHKDETFDPSYKRFHAKGCMEKFISNNAQAFANLVDSISHNVIEDINNNPIEKG